MSKKKQEDRKVVFRRIGGRIIPITVGAGALSLSNRRVLNKIDDKAMEAVKKEFIPKAKTTGSFMKTQSKKHSLLERLYKKDITRYLKKDHKNSLGYRSSPVEHNPFSNGSYYDQNGIISLKNVDEPTFLHEMGHAIQDRKKTKLQSLRKKYGFSYGFKDIIPSKLNKINRKVFGKRYNEATFGQGGKVSNFLYKNIHKNKLRPMAKGIGEFIDDSIVFAHEAEAWKFGFNIKKGKKGKIRFAKRASAALYTYARKPAIKAGRLGLITSGAGLITYGLFKKDRKK